MTKQIQVSDNLYQQLKDLSDKGYRTITGQLQYMADNITSVNTSYTPMILDEFIPSAPTATGYPCCTNKTPCKHWSFNGDEGVWTNSLTGETREV